MLRIIWLILVSLPTVCNFFWKGLIVRFHKSRYSRDKWYETARKFTLILQKNGFITTKVFGADDLPKEGGYIMYSNHQGHYDALGIVASHEKPLSVVIDRFSSHLPFAEQYVSFLHGIRLDRRSIRTQYKGLMQVIEEVGQGRRILIFPEGWYGKNRNRLTEFRPGSFKCAIKAKCPIVPVALIDSYKVFDTLSLKPVTSEVHFLKPIAYDEYKDMNSIEISEMVKKRIEDTIAQYTDGAKK